MLVVKDGRQQKKPKARQRLYIYQLYAQEDYHGTWKCPLGKGYTSTNHRFLDSMFVFGVVSGSIWSGIFCFVACFLPTNGCCSTMLPTIPTYLGSRTSKEPLRPIQHSYHSADPFHIVHPPGKTKNPVAVALSKSFAFGKTNRGLGYLSKCWDRTSLCSRHPRSTFAPR